MSDLDQVVTRAAVLKALLDRVAAAYDEARASATEILGAEGRKNAVVGDTKVASVSVTKSGRVSVNEPVLSRWVAENYPTEVETRAVVRPAFLEAIKRRSQEMGMPCSPTGEVDIPGVFVGDAYCSVRFADGGREVVAELWRQGRIDLETGTIKEIE